MTPIRPRWQKILRYLFSGVLANGVDIGLYLLLLWGGVPYLIASWAGNIFGFFASFYLHKYVSFEAQGQSGDHMVRYIIVTIINLLAQSVILYICVQLLGVPETWAKVIANGTVVVWNFFLYQLFVYKVKK